MKFINLTPPDITVILPDTTTETNRVRTFHRDGTVARVSQNTSVAFTVDDINISTATFGPVVGLPERDASTLFIVSAMVKSASTGRTDLVSPGELVRVRHGQDRNDAGVVIGCKGFFC